MSSDLERKLRQALCEHPRRFDNRFQSGAQNALVETLFRSLTNDRSNYLAQLFPDGFPPSFRLQEVQGAQEDAEYTEAARGHVCGHIFKHGEASYHCGTCTDDPTAVLCARCFVSSDHEGHNFQIGTSAGNNGCCDCGDDEAWKRPVNCAIHTSTDDFMEAEADVSALPDDLQSAITITISCVLDYFCDVISCSPENLRQPKTVDLVQSDESSSRLKEEQYGVEDEIETNPEFCLILWNDEKHTIREVRDQIARACRERERWAMSMAEQANEHGRCVLRHSRDLSELLRMAKIIEEIKITVTIRSSRDTFREQMCETIIEWLSDIAGCSVFGDTHIIRRVICQEMLQLWRKGSQAWNSKVGRDELDDHEREDSVRERREIAMMFNDPIEVVIERAEEDGDEADDQDDEDMEIADDRGPLDSGDEEYDILDDAITETHVILDGDPDATDDADEMDTDGDNDFSDANERIDAMQPIPPPPPPPIGPGQTNEPAIAANTETLSRQESDLDDADQNRNYQNIPKVIGSRGRHHDSSPNHWTINTIPTPHKNLPVHEDLRKNIRVDSMILFDLRLWKQVRRDVRDLMTTTLVNIPQFRRILGLRFSGLYTTLAQLYLVADREPDHSIISLSLQLLTTPSITEEVIEKGNFLTVLMAILYTFLTTRQVGFPSEVDPDAVLGFDAGSVANRRLYHFFGDLGYFLASPFVQTKLRSEKQYLFEYLDLAKLSQGICPNVRAVGEHVEYETDAWISASLLTKEINKLCRQFAEAFQSSRISITSLESPTCEAIRNTARTAIINSIGLEHQRFEQSEIKDIVKFHPVGPFPFDPSLIYKVIQFSVEKGSMSFHHPLHYTLSWLLEGGKDSPLSIEALKNAADNVVGSLHEKNVKIRGSYLQAIYAEGEDALLALFDYPLRVCAWLAQMKANLWVRNGMSLRHQMSQYKGTANRSTGHHRDIFLLQTALVACHPGRVLASMIDRYGLQSWLSGKFGNLPECEDGQTLEIIEDFVSLLITLLSDRDCLMSRNNEPESQLATLRKDIAHTLCFKPLSFTDLTGRLSERAQDHEQLQEVLDVMTTYRAPEGLHDTGLFELKSEFLDELDPYNSHFSKNQRDEAENIYKTWKAKMLKKPVDDVVLEPKLHPIRSEAYLSLCAVITDPLFANVIHALLTYVASAKELAPNVSITRVEAFLQVLLHLILVATLEDGVDNGQGTPTEAAFIRNALSLEFVYKPSKKATIVEVLHQLWSIDDFSSCRSKIRYILRAFNNKQPILFGQITANLNIPHDRFDTASPANVESDTEAKKKQALERRQRIMAQMQQQQQSFMDKQGVVDWGDDDLSDTETNIPSSTERRIWKFPSGVCIQCREECNDSRLYGTFAMVTDAHVLRQTPVVDEEIMREIVSVPTSLDESIEDHRPFGISGSNHELVRRLKSDGSEIMVDKQGLGKGWPRSSTAKGPLSTSCGHIMHFACFETYFGSVVRRHNQQIARDHAERTELNEFVCPLCKALANIFLPIVWKSTEQSYPGSLATGTSFDIYLDYALPTALQQHKAKDYSDDELEKKLHVSTVLSFNTSAMVPLVNALKPTEGTAGNVVHNWTEQRNQPGHSALSELSEAYRRLRQTLDLTDKSQSLPAPTEAGLKADQFKTLVDILANSVTAVETAYRGREGNGGGNVISSIPSTTLSHLQVMSSTIHAYAASTALELGVKFTEQHRRGFYGVMARLLQDGGEVKQGHKLPAPALATDGFAMFVESVMTIGRTERFPIPHLMRICLTLELVRVVMALLAEPDSCVQASAEQGRLQFDANELDTKATQALIGFVERQLRAHVSQDTKLSQSGPVLGVLAKALQSFTLVYLRKAAIFLHVANGVDLPATPSTDSHYSELEHLSRLLSIPSLSTILLDFTENSGKYSLHKLAGHWIRDAIEYRKRSNGSVTASIPPLRLLHPTPLELVGLPQYFDVLVAESHKRKCPTTGKEMTDPALCLFCGEIFCAQAVCCMTDWNRGGCNVHVEKCSAPIGLFLFIRKCFVVLFHIENKPKKGDEARARQTRGGSLGPSSDVALSHGCFLNAPYLTKHGETDGGLRSRHRLILNQKRYDKLLRDAWLMVNGSIWSTVARKLESEVNNGGWETL